jgi:hypothetical protein
MARWLASDTAVCMVNLRRDAVRRPLDTRHRVIIVDGDPA